MKNLRKVILILLLVCLASLCVLVGCGKKTYTVEYETNGGIVSETTRQVHQDAHFVLDVPYMENANFIGWYDSADENANAITDEYGRSLTEFDYGKDIVVFARWEYWETSGLQYTLSGTGDSYYVTGGGEGLSLIRIPAQYLGKDVVRVASYAFADNYDLREVVLPETITSIETNAFAECRELVNVTMSDNVRRIEKNAFSECEKLAKISVSKNLEFIGDSAFFACKSLLQMDFSAIQGELEIEENAFKSCSVLNKVAFNQGLKLISENLFLGCTSLTEINVGDYVEEIQPSAFANSGLRKLTIGKNVHTIGSSFTDGCTNLSEIIVSAENGYFTSIDNVLYDAEQKTLIRYSPKIETTEHEILNSVELILSSSFDSVEYLKELTVGNQVKEIQQGAFSNMKVLEKMNIPFIGGSKSFNNYFAYVFGGVFMESNTRLPETLLYVNLYSEIDLIPAYAFQFCGNLRTITIPDSVRTIGEAAFYGCSNLTDIVLPKSLTSMGEFAYYACMRITQFNISEDNEYFHTEEGVLYSKDKNILLQYPSAKSDKSYTVLSTVKTIAKGAIYNVGKLESLILPDGLIKVDDYAFALCRKLKNIVLPSGVVYIGTQAFAGCRALEQLNIPAQTATIGAQCFYDCRALVKIEMQCEQIPETTTTVFLEASEDLKIYVKDSITLEAYKMHDIWKNFAEKFVLED